MYLINVALKTSDNNFFIKTKTNLILVKESTKTASFSELVEPVLYLTFNKNISQDTNMLDVYRAIIYNNFVLKYNFSLTSVISIYNNNMANLAFSYTSLQELKSDLNEGFILYNDIVLTNATVEDQSVKVKTLSVVVQTVSENTGVGSDNTVNSITQKSASSKINVRSFYFSN